MTRRDISGFYWGELTSEEQDYMLHQASPIDARTCEKPLESGKCTIDFENGLSIAGNLLIKEDENVITIDNDALFYFSCDENEIVFKRWLEDDTSKIYF